MTLKPLGDSAWLVEFLGNPGAGAVARVAALEAALAEDRPPGVRDVVPSFTSVAVHFDSEDGLGIREWIQAAMLAGGPASNGRAPRVFEIPVAYGGESGPDLNELAAQVGLSAEEVVALHAGADYTVAALGFSPGFPYLSGLPERLRVPRRQTPRLVVPAGSVAVAGGQVGIYPFATPGGWHLLGRTAVKLFDPREAEPALLRVGDRLRFVPVESVEFEADSPELPVVTGGRWIEVIHPGGMTTVQDLGRPGHQACGVSPGGAVDRWSLRVANLLVGNDENTAALEICASGPVLKFHAEATLAFVSGAGRPRRVKRGETIDLSNLGNSVRACLAVAGGLQVERMLGSAATDPPAGFGGLGGRALVAGDRLEFGVAGRVPGGRDWHVGRVPAGRNAEIELRFLAGVQEPWFCKEARRRLREEVFRVTPQADRMGTRLSGDPLELENPRELVSQPVACGSVQVPPDGQPIVLMAGRQTIGGYPQIGHVISVDLPKLARAWPGTRVRFRELGWEEARERLMQERQDFAWLRTGLEILKHQA
ncbi:MAG: 5-oxoprolinase subunit PxpB [Akkermansiaceae bacterium]